MGRVTHFGWGLNGLRPDRWEDAQRELLSDGTVVPVEIAGLAGEWFAHRDALDASFRPRTTLLCPFDRLVYIRERTEELFGFHYRLEMYVPKSKRRYGYYVLPILDGHRLVGRVDPFFDRRTATLRINAVYAEDGAPGVGRPPHRRGHRRPRPLAGRDRHHARRAPFRSRGPGHSVGRRRSPDNIVPTAGLVSGRHIGSVDDNPVARRPGCPHRP